MHIIGLVLTVLGGIAFWYYRMQAAREASETLVDAANDVRLAAKRFAYRRRVKTHPLDCVEDARVAALGIAASIVQIERGWDKDISDTMIRQAQSLFDIDVKEAAEMVVLAKWLSDQATMRADAARRLTRRVRALVGPAALPDLQRLLTILIGPEGSASENVEEARAAMIRDLQA
ncbi:hypothetical protein [Szabonella alba]|uniref:Co-chaperone DjlA N-terminal domain-containing protein n=1 Tax=Szabonella alba TaxID=2804194 RepID=A0A8K0Y0X3_9RHOB|nr:hypothetical protein [Szabonella alba]MBL4918675.1 hypothetical protein [Szabonella alba]